MKLLAPDDRVMRIYALIKSENEGKAKKEDIAEEINRLTDELNNQGISDDHIANMLNAIHASESVNERLRHLNGQPSSKVHFHEASGGAAADPYRSTLP